MSAKGLFICFIIELLLCKTVEPMPDIYCVIPYPAFSTITNFFNGSYFMADNSGRFWNIRSEQKFKSLDELQQKNNGLIRKLETQGKYYMNHRIEEFQTFHLTFQLYFDGVCTPKPAQLFGIHLLSNGSTAYTINGGTGWSDPSIFTKGDRVGHGVFDKVYDQVNFSRPIKAVLAFTKGVLFIQDTNWTYVYCDSNKGWTLDTDSVKGYVVFEPKNVIQFGEIFGGYVDNDNKYSYLFAGQIDSSDSYVRKYFYKCEHRIKEEKPKKMRLLCEKLYYKGICGSSANDSFDYIILALIIAIVFVIIFILLVICYVCLRVRRRANRTVVNNTSDTSLQTEQKPIGLARKRGFGATKPSLARTRTRAFSANNSDLFK